MINDIWILIFPLLMLIIVIFSIKIVPQQQAWIVERFGRYNKTLHAGLSFILPGIDLVAYKHTLKERAIDVIEQSAITKDNVTLFMDGIVYVRVINPYDASYGVENPYYAVTQLAQTSMRSAIGKLTMDVTFEERDLLNAQIVNIINEAARTWGIQCMRYEIRDIRPPTNVLKSMEMQVAAERQKRAEILESEGKMQAMVNIAEGKKKGMVLGSEGAMTEQINRATGESEAIKKVAEATAVGIREVAEAIGVEGGSDAVAMRIAEQYVEAFKDIAGNSNTMIIPQNASEIGSVVAQALGIFKQLASLPTNNNGRPKKKNELTDKE